jgi:hypothetical protein
VHPIERLRYVSRAGWAGASSLGEEAAYALAGLSEHEPAALVPACRRLLERNPWCGPLWWVAARMLTGGDAFDEAALCVEELEEDPTQELLEDAYLERRVVRHGGVAEVAAADVVLLETDAMGADGIALDVDDSRLLDAARDLGTELWVAGGVGRVLPPRLWAVARELMARRTGGRSRVQSPFFDDGDLPTVVVEELGGVTMVAGPRGVVSLAAALVTADFPEPPELATPW